jgi:serine O-acetyltransferase
MLTRGNIIITFSFIRLIPHILYYRSHKNRSVIEYDVSRWVEITGIGAHFGFVRLMTFFPEFRNLFYNRLGKSSRGIKWLCPPMKFLLLATRDIGPGLFIQHGFATLVGAKSIGKDCWINQQVSIGYTNATDTPTLGDNVTVFAGAKILGNVHVGSDSTVGANAVVVKNVPPGCVVVGVPAYIVRRDGVSVRENL